MKKIIFFFLSMVCLSSVFAAENLKIKVDGPESSYNQLRITNNTDYSDFDVNVYLLEEKDNKYIIKEMLGTFHLKGKDDTDSCRMNLKNGQVIGISLPKDFEEIVYTATYQDLPFFDIMQLKLTSKAVDDFGNDPIGKEF